MAEQMNRFMKEIQELKLYYVNEVSILRSQIDNKPVVQGITPDQAIQMINSLKGFHSDPTTGVIQTSGDSVFTDLIGQFCYMFNQTVDGFDEETFKYNAYKEIV